MWLLADIRRFSRIGFRAGCLRHLAEFGKRSTCYETRYAEFAQMRSRLGPSKSPKKRHILNVVGADTSFSI